MIRFLHILLAFLLVFSASTGNCVQKCAFKSSDEIKIVKVISSTQEILPLRLTESKNVERMVSRLQKKSLTFQDFSTQPLFAESKLSFFQFFFSTKITAISARVFLLPKSLKTVIFLQTVI